MELVEDVLLVNGDPTCCIVDLISLCSNMGCICSKASAVEDSKEAVTKKFQSYSTRPSELNVLRLNSTRRVDEGGVKDVLIDGGHVKGSLIERKANGSGQLYGDHHDVKKKLEKPGLTVVDHIGPGRVPKAIEGEQVAAGWPAWLSSVAGEAIKGWIPRSANTFERLHKVSYCLVCYVCACIIIELLCDCYCYLMNACAKIL